MFAPPAVVDSTQVDGATGLQTGAAQEFTIAFTEPMSITSLTTLGTSGLCTVGSSVQVRAGPSYTDCVGLTAVTRITDVTTGWTSIPGGAVAVNAWTSFGSSNLFAPRSGVVFNPGSFTLTVRVKALQSGTTFALVTPDAGCVSKLTGIPFTGSSTARFISFDLSSQSPPLCIRTGEFLFLQTSGGSPVFIQTGGTVYRLGAADDTATYGQNGNFQGVASFTVAARSKPTYRFASVAPLAAGTTCKLAVTTEARSEGSNTPMAAEYIQANGIGTAPSPP